MRIFISHSASDVKLARRLRDRLCMAGLDVFWAEDEVFPGDNWALAIGQALESADQLIVLLTPHIGGSVQLQREVQYALGTSRFKDRVLPVFVGETALKSKDVPWILRHMPYVTVEPKTDFTEVLDHLAVHAE